MSPYINPSLREGLRPRTKNFAQTGGELNYQFSCLIIDYILHNGLKYQNINDISGAALNAVQEMYRRLAAAVEDDAIGRNGDIYDELLELL